MNDHSDTELTPTLNEKETIRKDQLKKHTYTENYYCYEEF